MNPPIDTLLKNVVPFGLVDNKDELNQLISKKLDCPVDHLSFFKLIPVDLEEDLGTETLVVVAEEAIDFHEFSFLKYQNNTIVQAIENMGHVMSKSKVFSPYHPPMATAQDAESMLEQMTGLKEQIAHLQTQLETLEGKIETKTE
ncbi:hypothetical protein PCE1_002937 [Barthelona sp. PCE]